MDETEMNPDELLDRAVDAMREVQPPRPFSADRFVHSLPGPGGQPRKGKTLFRRPLATRRLRVAAALAILSALVVTVVLTRMPGTVALGDVIDQFRRARGMTARVTIKMPGQPPRTYRAMFLGDRSRSETPGTIEITDPSHGQALTLDLRNKTATILHLDRALPATRPAADPQAVDWFVELQQLQQSQGRATGRRMIQGRAAEGFEVKKAGSTILLWADRQTHEPCLIQAMSNVDGTEVPAVEMDQISLSPQLPESLFSLDVPPGYVLRHVHFHVNDKPVGEEDLIEFLRRYAEQNDGRFPEAIGGTHWAQSLRFLQQMEATQPANQELVDFAATATRAIVFVNKLDNGWQYLGANVRLGEATRPIFQYHADAAAGLRVIYGDLHCGDLGQ